MKTSANFCKWLIVSTFAIFAAALFSQAQSSNSCTPAPSGLVAWWQAENNGIDSVSGNTAYAALLPDGVTFAPGKVGQAFSLNGTNAYLFVPSSPSLNVGAGPGLTMEGWIKVSSVAGLHPIAEWHGKIRESTGVVLWLDRTPFQNGALVGGLIDTNNGEHYVISAENLVQPNVFQHVALTYDKASGIGTLYLNGAMVAQENLGTFEPLTTSDFWIGHRTLDVPGDWSYGATLGGLLDELSIYDRALSADEIAAIYNAGSAGKCSNSSAGAAPTITHQPADQTVTAGANATFSVTVNGEAPLYYQWYGPTNNAISGAITSTLTLSNVQPANAGTYFVIVTNASGFAQSSNAVLAITSGTGGDCTPPPNGLVGWWPGENNAVDIIGGNNGTLVNGVGFTTGEVGQGFRFTHTNQNVLISANSNLDVGLGDGLTLEAWIDPTAITNLYPVFEWNPGDGVTYWGVHMYVFPGGTTDSGSLYADVQGVGDVWHQMQSADGVITANRLQHVALTYDKTSGVARLYRNGLIVSEATFGSFTPKTTGNLNIGSRPTDPANSSFTFFGVIDEPSVYNRALSSNEIAAIYSAGSNGKCPVAPSGTAPVITQQPTNQTVPPGGTATFSVTATGTQPLYYQWRQSGTPIPNATNSTLMVPVGQNQFNIQMVYSVVVSNIFGTAVSSNAIVIIGLTRAPSIVTQPSNQTVPAGSNATFTVVADGVLPLYYQWYGPTNNPIPGAVASILTLSNVQPAQAGTYFVIITNVSGFARSSNAVLTVTGGGSNTNSCTPAPSGLVGWWPGEGNAVDVIGGNNGTLVNGVGFTAGEVGQGFLFTQTNQNVLISANSNLDVGQGDGFTLEAWIKPADITNRYPIFEWNPGDGVTYWGVHFYVFPTGASDGSTGYLYTDVQGADDSWHTLQSPHTVVTAHTLQHVALTYDKTSGVARMYCNGLVVAEATFGSYTPKTTGPLNIGSRPNDPGNQSYTFFGVIDEPSVYNRALSSNEIAAIYGAGVNGKCPVSSGTAPVITQQPTNQTVAAGGIASFTVTATGTVPLYYQWFGPGSSAVPGAIASTLTLTNVQPAQAGTYFARVTNAFGFAQSSNAALTVTGGGSTNDCTPAPSGLVGLWRGDGNTADAAGSNNGSVFGGFLSYAAGEVNQAFHYTGGSGFVQIPAAQSLNVGLAAGFTIEGWIQPSDLVNQMPLVEWQFNTNNNLAGACFWASAIGGSGCLFADIVDTTGQSHQVFSAAGLLTTNYQHVALTYVKTNGMATIYRNGVLVAQANLGSFTPNTTANLLLGERTYYGGPQNHYIGNLDEMSLYNRALSQGEIQSIFFTGTGGKCAPSQIVPHATINQQPAVNASVVDGAPMLSWPASAADYILQSADSLTPPIQWTNVPATLHTNGDTIEATLPDGGPQGYFRLFHP